jgi:hypothetical protein
MKPWRISRDATATLNEMPFKFLPLPVTLEEDIAIGVAANELTFTLWTVSTSRFFTLTGHLFTKHHLERTSELIYFVFAKHLLIFFFADLYDSAGDALARQTARKVCPMNS